MFQLLIRPCCQKQIRWCLICCPHPTGSPHSGIKLSRLTEADSQMLFLLYSHLIKPCKPLLPSSSQTGGQHHEKKEDLTHAHMCSSMWRPKVNTGHLPQWLSTASNFELTERLNWLAASPQYPPISYTWDYRCAPPFPNSHVDAGTVSTWLTSAKTPQQNVFMEIGKHTIEVIRKHKNSRIELGKYVWL